MSEMAAGDPAPESIIHPHIWPDKELFLDPSVQANLYQLPLWLLIPEDEEPQFSDTYEYLIVSRKDVMGIIPHSRDCVNNGFSRPIPFLI
ncbi:hypothetical protein Tco_0198110 [Tanacetum coccineum]